VLVVADGYLGSHFQYRNVTFSEDAATDRGVRLHELELLGRELAGLEQNLVGDADLANVMERGGTVDRGYHFAVQPNVRASSSAV